MYRIATDRALGLISSLPQGQQFAVLYLALGVTFPFVVLWLAALTDTGNWIRILGVICGVGLIASSGFFFAAVRRMKRYPVSRP